jgi:hypothetical protein
MAGFADAEVDGSATSSIVVTMSAYLSQVNVRAQRHRACNVRVGGRVPVAAEEGKAPV